MLTREELHDVLVKRHGEAVQEKLDRACVGIAGLGGLGSNIAVHLARLGVGKLVLADFDRVEATNLNRQHYTLSHLGCCKTDSILAQLMEINPYLCYEATPVRITPENAGSLFGGCDIVCEAFDCAEEKAMLIETLLVKLPKVTVISGNGMAGYGPANRIVTRHPMNRLYLCGDETSGIADGLGLLAPRVAVCAAHQATAVMRLILGETEQGEPVQFTY